MRADGAASTNRAMASANRAGLNMTKAVVSANRAGLRVE